MRLAIAAALLFTLHPAAAAAERPIAFSRQAPAQGSLVLPLSSAADLSRHQNLLDSGERAAVARALEVEDFGFKPRSKLLLRSIGRWSHLLVIGTGTDPLGASALQDIGGVAAQELNSVDGPMAIAADGLRASVAAPAAEIAVGARLGGYSFDKYKFVDPAEPASPGRSAAISILTSTPQAEQAYASRGSALVEAVDLARDLIREPGNVIYPESFVERTRSALAGVPGVTLRVMDEQQMEQLGMGSLLSVGRGSSRPPRLLIVEYRGAPANQPMVALAGKGITFDTGGISLKPSAGMDAMKGDMAGAAAVVATAMSLARSRAAVNVVALAALAENMPSGTATRPGDVVRSFNGKTIEILNTDAEGRLVLADAVAYAERTYRPAAIVDIATLTGAVRTALGDEYAGLFSRNDALAAQLAAAGEVTGEEVWRLPLHPNYAEDMKSDIADIRNSAAGAGAGAGLGAHFIGFFVDSTPWAHLDIAGVDLQSAALPTVPKGLSGFGIRLLDRFVRDFRAVPATDPGPGS